jgi:hypothetical protein
MTSPERTTIDPTDDRGESVEVAVIRCAPVGR